MYSKLNVKCTDHTLDMNIDNINSITLSKIINTNITLDNSHLIYVFNLIVKLPQQNFNEYITRHLQLFLSLIHSSKYVDRFMRW